jgi:ATP-dependent DNA ligase
MVLKRRESKYRSGRSTSWLKIKSNAIDEYKLLGVEREAGKPAFALMAYRATGKYARPSSTTKVQSAIAFGSASQSMPDRRQVA